MKLTPAQQQLVEDNHNLIYGFLKKHNLPFEEYYGVAAIGLCKAACTFAPEKGASFSTYAYKVIYNQVKYEWKKNSRSIATCVSFNEPLTNDIEESRELIDTIPDTIDRIAEVDLIESVMKELRMTGPRLADVADLLSKGYNQIEVAQAFNIHRQQVSRYKKRIAKIVKEIL